MSADTTFSEAALRPFKNRQTEEALRASEERYQQLFEGMLEGVAYCRVLFDESGEAIDWIYLDVNEAFERLTHLGPITGKKATEAIPGILESNPELFDIYGRVARTGVPEEFETYVEQLGIHFHISVFRPAPDHFVAVFENTTERRRAEEERALLQAQLLGAQKMEALGKLAGGISHNFNNLLTGILGYAELALAKLPDESEAHDDVKEVVEAAARARDVVGGLLAFSRHQPTYLELLDLNTVVSELDGLLRQLIGADVQIKTALASEVAPIEADRSQFEQAIVNLVVNARDAMPHGGELIIETSNLDLSEILVTPEGSLRPGLWVTLAVRDTGVGMDERTKERIFEPFFSTKGEQGTGLGLASVFGVVTEAGGQILVNTRPGDGTTFTLCLPAVLDRGLGLAP